MDQVIQSSKKVTIVVPCYNEEEVLYTTNKRLMSVCDSLIDNNLAAETVVLYVDDGSKDKTWNIIKEFASQSNDKVKGLKLAHNVGHQNALIAGLTECYEWCDCAVTIDADLQDDETKIAEMLEKHIAGSEIVYGVRDKRNTDTFFKRTTAEGFYKMMDSMGCKTVFNHADFRLMGKRSIAALLSMPERNLFIRGMVRLTDQSEDFVYYDRTEREAGTSKYPLTKMLNFAIDGITSFTVKPLRLIFSMGTIFIIVAVVMMGYTLYSHFFNTTLPGWSSLMISLWFIGGAILLSLGIVGEYIGKIYTEVKARPRFFIAERI